MGLNTAVYLDFLQYAQKNLFSFSNMFLLPENGLTSVSNQ